MKIFPGEGLGPIHFGLTPREVKAICGENQVYEEWMGGNLNSSLFYTGIIIYFDQCDSFGPLECSHVTDFNIYKTFKNLEFMGLNVFSCSVADIERKLHEERISFEDYGDIEVPSLGLEFGPEEFPSSDSLICGVGLWKVIKKEGWGQIFSR